MNKILFILLFLVFAAYGQQQKRIAIINTVDDEEPPLKASELNQLTNSLRGIATEVLPQKNYAVMTQQSIVAFLGTQEEAAKKCRESECLAQLGREVNADYVGQARIGRFGDDYSINFELYESGKGTLVSSFNGFSGDIYGLLAIINEKAPILFKKLQEVSGSKALQGGISGLTGTGEVALDYGKRYLVNVSSQPTGAALSFDGAPISSCMKTPCSAELTEGKVRIMAVLAQHETIDTMVSVTNNNQSIVLPLKSNFGIFEVKPVYLGDVGEHEDWILSINNKIYDFGEIRFSPGEYAVKLSHECYEDLNFNVGIIKGSREIFDMSGKIKLKQGVLSLSAERDGIPVSEPVFVNGKQVGDTPFDGPVPLCSDIEIGIEMDAVSVKLKHNERVAYKHVMRSEKYAEIYKPEFEKKSKSGGGFWVGLTLDLIGAGLITYGIIKNSEVKDLHSEYMALPPTGSAQFAKKWKEADDARNMRNVLYIAGGVVLATGIGVHIWF
ncbi:MAG: hypothetical protein FWC26_00720 [Fibromonadales bacterium]|nr:hypothetical protein [Fibromonadales bacterium]